MRFRPALVPFVFACGSSVTLSLGCGGTAPTAEAPVASPPPDPSTPAMPPAPAVAAAPAETTAAADTPPAPASPAPTPAPRAESLGGAETGQPVATEASTSPDDAALVARANGPATGGPRGNRPCAFHESVDTYQRQCLAKVNPDGSVLVSAKGTKLNPDHGFEFTLHGGSENQWVAKGTLNAFGLCKGPFVAPVTSYLDHGVKTYELRFKQHCMIVVR